MKVNFNITGGASITLALFFVVAFISGIYVSISEILNGDMIGGFGLSGLLAFVAYELYRGSSIKIDRE